MPAPGKDWHTGVVTPANLPTVTKVDARVDIPGGSTAGETVRKMLAEHPVTAAGAGEHGVGPEFKAFSKIPRLSRLCTVTEKIDGTLGLVYVSEDLSSAAAGSKSRWVTPGKTTDNYGFAAWVQEHADELKQLGPGYHYGEWFGAGIQRQYGQEFGTKAFALFNVSRWHDPKRPATPGLTVEDSIDCPPCCTVVPILYRGTFNTLVIGKVVKDLAKSGSVLVPGFMRPEGVVVFHEASGHLYKKTIEGDEKPKGAAQ